MGLSKLSNRKSKKEQVVETPVMANSEVFAQPVEREVYRDERPVQNDGYVDYNSYGNIDELRSYESPVQAQPVYAERVQPVDPYGYEVAQPRTMEHRVETRQMDARQDHRVMETRQMDPRMGGMPQDPRNREMVVDRRVQDSYQDPRFHRGGEITDRRYHPVASMEVTRMSDFSYSNPDKYGLQILDVRSSDKVKLLKPRALGVEPLVISNIVDRDGKVAEKLYRYMDRYGITVLPLRECGVFEGITSIEGFKIVEIRGKKFASYCGDAYPSNYVDNLIRVIADRISSAQPYGIVEDEETMGGYRWNKEESRLSRFVTISGKEVEIPSLCNSEIEYICAVLANYNCNIVEVTDDFAHIIVGVDLAGMGFGEQEN